MIRQNFNEEQSWPIADRQQRHSVAVAMSGGVDSTACAMLLKRQGYNVFGFHMLLHPGSVRSWIAAKKASDEIGVPIQQVDFTSDFKEHVIAPFLKEYSLGRTPSPCAVCNRAIKFGLLFAVASRLGFDRIASGHYARIEYGDDPALLTGSDLIKDQSYFLFGLQRAMLPRILFPIGAFTKDTIKEMLRNEGISVWKKEESQELCFIPDNNYGKYLTECGIPAEPGDIVDTHGRTIGKHRGIIFYTVGQRRGLGIPAQKPLYVIRIDAEKNLIVVGSQEETFRESFELGNVNLLRNSPPRLDEKFTVKVRSTAKAVPCTITDLTDGDYTVLFDEPQSGIAPGQAGVIYSGDRVVAGGWIK